MKDSDFSGSVAMFEESNELLMASEVPIGCEGSKAASIGSIECRGLERAMIMIEV